MSNQGKRIFNTYNFGEIQKVCLYAHSNSLLIGINGYTGAGKTTALRHYATNENNTLYILRTVSMNTIDFYKDILLELNPNANVQVKINYIIKQIVFLVNSMDKKQLLIIDDSGKFSPKDLEYLHELRESTQENLGIILSGVDYYFIKMKDWKDRDVKGVAELMRRVFGVISLERPMKQEIIEITKAYGISDENIINKWSKKIDNFGRLFDLIKEYKNRGDDTPIFDGQFL